MFRGKRDRVDRLNAEASEQYAKACEAWEQALADHEDRETVRLELFDSAKPLTADRVQDYLSDVLACVEWPRETIVSLECDDSVMGVMIDIDLPEIEDMPDKSAAVAARGLKLNIKDRPETQRRREYMIHVHGVAFRVIGEVFAALPRIQRVMCSGFSQRVDRSTGQVGHEYLFSIRLPRAAWMAINFSRLADLDLPSCLGTFDMRREMTSKGVFRPIEPFNCFESPA